MTARALIGVLAVQGAFVEHQESLRALGADTCQVRRPDELAACDALVIPGGESTTLGLVAGESGLVEAVRGRVADGMPVFGTCAGLIMLAREVTSGSQPLVGAMDITARRNAWGRQRASFEARVAMPVVGDEPITGVFIRAPWIERYGDDVEVLATWDGHPVAARQANMLVTAFHPELTDDPRVHELFVEMVGARRAATDPDPVGGASRVRPQ